jgi:hypothetical protein
MGDFNAEMHLRDSDLCLLPAVADQQARRIVAAMDELLFPMCEPNDLLVTRGRFDPDQQIYLESLGFRFMHLAAGTPDIRLEKIKKALLNQPSDDWQLRPFAWTPQIVELGEKSGIIHDGPLLDTVRRVNSKVYSTKLRDRIGLENPAIIINRATELAQAGATIMNDSKGVRKLLLKDPFGVSGTGNITVSSPTMLKRLAQYFAHQERLGKRTLLVLEPLFKRRRDFSCQIHINRRGERTVLSIQEIANQEQAYTGSRKASDTFIETLDTLGYFQISDEVARLLYKDGYWGPLCIDSMVLGDGTLFPVVEVNARMSMGALNHLIDIHLPSEADYCWLSHISLSLSTPLLTAQLLEALDSANLLYSDPERGGVFPLASGPLSVNAAHTAEGECFKARLYYKSMIGANMTHSEQLVRLRNILSRLCGLNS